MSLSTYILRVLSPAHIPTGHFLLLIECGATRMVEITVGRRFGDCHCLFKPLVYLVRVSCRWRYQAIDDVLRVISARAGSMLVIVANHDIAITETRIISTLYW
jgi:hypothetical protein